MARSAASSRKSLPRAAAPPAPGGVELPRDVDEVTVKLGERTVKLTNLRKVYFPEAGLTKRDLLQHYLDMAPALLPHLASRAMVMKRYPHGIHGEHFFMKRAPAPRPEWIVTCSIEHASGNVIAFPVVDDLAALLWIVNLGCIDLNPWYARCDDVHRPDYLHFDLDPVEGDTPVPFGRVLEAALQVRDALAARGLPAYPKTTGSRGVHVYVPIRRGPTQKEVWTVAKALALDLAAADPRLLTAEYKVAKRPPGRVLVDYNQNAWGRTLASVYSVRPREQATVSAPLTWAEVEEGVKVEQFRVDTMNARLARVGDLFAPLLPDAQPRADLGAHLAPAAARIRR